MLSTTSMAVMQVSVLTYFLTIYDRSRYALLLQNANVVKQCQGTYIMCHAVILHSIYSVYKDQTFIFSIGYSCEMLKSMSVYFLFFALIKGICPGNAIAMHIV